MFLFFPWFLGFCVVTKQVELKWAGVAVFTGREKRNFFSFTSHSITSKTALVSNYFIPLYEYMHKILSEDFRERKSSHPQLVFAANGWNLAPQSNMNMLGEHVRCTYNMSMLCAHNITMLQNNMNWSHGSFILLCTFVFEHCLWNECIY